jgi:Eukaryotic aspartyl protease
VTITYGSGSLTGYIAEDVLEFGGKTINNQKFVYATYEPGDAFKNAEYDGILVRCSGASQDRVMVALLLAILQQPASIACDAYSSTA